MIKNDLILSC